MEFSLILCGAKNLTTAHTFVHLTFMKQPHHGWEARVTIIKQQPQENGEKNSSLSLHFAFCIQMREIQHFLCVKWKFSPLQTSAAAVAAVEPSTTILEFIILLLVKDTALCIHKCAVAARETESVSRKEMKISGC